jgi:hypothetical protein
MRPSARSSATTRGECVCATGTITRSPAIAAVPLIGARTLRVHLTLPVVAFSAWTQPWLVPATSVFCATTGVPVKSPLGEK